LNYGTTWTRTALAKGIDANIEVVPDAPNKLYLHGNAGSGDPHSIKATENEGATLYDKCGANANIPDTGGGDSIPKNASVRDLTPIWTLE